MMTDKERKLVCQSTVNSGLKIQFGDSYIEPSKNVIDSAHYTDLSRMQVVQGVVALVHALNLSGGSVGDMDLYKLVYGYLTNPVARGEINQVAGRHEF